MATSKNIKRAKLLKQKKKNRENVNTNSQIKDIPVFLNPESETIIIDRALTGRPEKISALILEMIAPVLQEMEDPDDLEGIISLGVVAWNCGILRTIDGDNSLSEILKDFPGKKYSVERKLLDEYIEIKCTRYKEYNDIVIDFNIERQGTSVNFTVKTALNDNIVNDLLLNESF
jgi:phage FluMu protein Com